MGTVLVTGIAGGLSLKVMERLLASGHEVVGVDYRRTTDPIPRSVKVYRANYNKTGIEDVFKHHRFDAVLHLGRVGNLKEGMGKRFDLNVVGSQKIMNLCRDHKVGRLIVLSTFHIYGAHPANHVPISEEDPVRAGLSFPQIADAIQLDNMASTWIYRFPEVCTSVIRVTNVVGPDINNTLSNMMRRARVPYLFGFNPMTQFIHQDDLADAVLAALAKPVPGVFNLAGPDIIPWKTALKLIRAKTYPLPSSAVSAYLSIWPHALPQYLVNFFKYPCVISDRMFRQSFDWQPRKTVEETLWSTVRAARALQHPG